MIILSLKYPATISKYQR